MNLQETINREGQTAKDLLKVMSTVETDSTEFKIIECEEAVA